jgi:hypothetical protein
MRVRECIRVLPKNGVFFGMKCVPTGQPQRHFINSSLLDIYNMISDDRGNILLLHLRVIAARTGVEPVHRP